MKHRSAGQGGELGVVDSTLFIHKRPINVNGAGKVDHRQFKLSDPRPGILYLSPC